MSNQIYEDVQTPQTEIVVIAGKFEGGASSAATVVTGAPHYTVVGAGSGVYTITFAKAYYELVSFVAGVGAATPANVDTYVVVADDFTSGTTLPITTSEGGTPTDIADDEYVHFIAVFRTR